MTEEGQTRILIADHWSSVRSAIREFLKHQPELEVLGEAENSQQLLKQVEAKCPDIVLLEWDLPNQPTANLIGAIHKLSCQPVVIALSVQPEDEQEALAAGAYAFISKNEPPKRLLTVIHAAILERNNE